MKYKASYIIVVCWIMVLGFLGSYVLFLAPKEAVASEKENRMLQEFPEFSVESMADGTATSELESFLSDKMIFRDDLTSASKSFMKWFSLLSSKDSLGEEGNELDFAGVGKEDEEDTDDSSPEENVDPDEDEAGENVTDGEEFDEGDNKENDDTGVQEPSSPAATEDYADTYYISDEAVWVGNSYDENFGYDNEYKYGDQLQLKLSGSIRAKDIDFVATYMVRQSIDPINSIAELVPDDGKLYVVPLFESKTIKKLKGHFYQVGSDIKIDSEIRQYLIDNTNDNVEVYSTLEILEDYLEDDSPVYYESDHHWTPYGAMLVANAVINDMGYVATEYDDYIKKVYKNSFEGSYSTLGDLNMCDDVDVIKELKPTQMYYMSASKYMEKITYIDENKPTYYAYMGGSIKPWRTVKTGSNTGRKALMFGDSFILTFAVAFNEIYDEIYIVDARKFNKSYNLTVKEIIEDYGIDDVFLVHLKDYIFDDTICKDLMALLD